MTDSFVQANAGGTTFVGPDAVKLYNAIALKTALRMYLRSSMIMARGFTRNVMLQKASELTSKPYKRSRTGCERALEDVTAWVEAMKAAMPVIQKEPG